MNGPMVIGILGSSIFYGWRDARKREKIARGEMQPKNKTRPDYRGWRRLGRAAARGLGGR